MDEGNGDAGEVKEVKPWVLRSTFQNEKQNLLAGSQPGTDVPTICRLYIAVNLIITQCC